MAYPLGVRITWDERKNATNKKKHQVGFEDAQALLLSEDDHLVIFDEEHSIDEDRFISIGPIRRGVILVVWTERLDGEMRIISARWATARETEMYRTHVGSDK